MYHQKYLKYKTKYNQLKNQTGGHTDIVQFINDSTLDTIKEELLTKIDNHKYCDIILGKGMMGEVYVPGADRIMNVRTSGGTSINMPIAVKKATDNGEFDIKMLNNKLYIYTYKNITTEALILSYTNKLWYQKKSPHLPFMIGYSCCNNKGKIAVDKIIIERQGLTGNVEFHADGFTEENIWHPPESNKDPNLFKSMIGTLGDLIKYVLVKMKDGKVELPNSVICNVVKLFDYLAISYFHTYNLLHKNNIIISDMHSYNIFIHWLGKDSYLDDLYIGDIKSVNYKYNKQILKIKTYGLLLKVGDLGSSIVIPRPDLYILGQAVDLEKNIELIDQMVKPNHSVYDFSYVYRNELPTFIYEKTVVSKFLSMHPYNKIVMGLPLPYDLLKDFLTPDKLLDHFKPYMIDDVEKNDTTLVVDEY